MDRQISPSKIKRKKLLRWLPVVVLIPVLYFMARAGNEKVFRVDSNSIKVGTVSFGEFQDVVSLNGVLEPGRTVHITALQGGRVEEILVEDGAFVEAGEDLMYLANSDLALDFMNRETQIVEQINNLRSTRIQLDQNKRQVQEQLLDVQYRYQERVRTFAIDSSLYKQGAIPKGDLDASANELIYLKGLIDLTRERLETDEAYRRMQLGRIDQSIELMERNLEAIRRSLDDLVIRAPISGQMSQFSHEIGETKQKGESLGRIDVLDSFLVSAPVDQFYLNRVSIGQEAIADLNGVGYELEVYKIFPAVENGQFEVHLRFTEAKIPNPRRGQNVRVRLSLSATEEALRIPKGGFYGSTGGRFVYVLTDEGLAQKREIELGAQNPEFYKVLRGLEEGEQVILSSYESFGDSETIKIK
ncbi:HlyD family efflux transporter periplasmic adaptor subunit [Cryomorphaceae bacterium 1068]|nr:HlyD family efflux transporter periplasmic adaptor subunit [Cryomorphaceae bacterium 1068]